jgi:indolepyruvate ferredoxin oxidoreductase
MLSTISYAEFEELFIRCAFLLWQQSNAMIDANNKPNKAFILNQTHLKKQNINLISHGDVGCYSLSFLEPFKEMHNLSAMGQGGALGAGVDLFTTNPSVVLMGDSTFFHSGITDISNSVQMNHDITYILLDNDNTAMTGHQFTPRTGESVEGFIRPSQDMLNMVKALGVNEAIEVNPSDRFFYQNLLREIISKKGTKVIISNKECGLTFHGKKKSIERKIFSNFKLFTIEFDLENLYM